MIRTQRAMTLAGRKFGVRQRVPPDHWAGLRRRTREALLSMRYVVQVEDPEKPTEPNSAKPGRR